MYAYDWDPETGGFILKNTPLTFSKEPRPVYYRELDLLKFREKLGWNYAPDDSAPYLWAEASNYFYRGRKVAMTKGGSLYTAPELIAVEDPEPNGMPMRQVDIPAMVEKNRGIMDALVQETIKKVYNTYMEYRSKVDIFYVAFSGGKDSIVALDIVQRALPHEAFSVLFGDTQMEFPDTYDLVEQVEHICRRKDIKFLRSISRKTPQETWNEFGPPATTTRWCCSALKTAPRIIALRKELNKSNFTGLAFIGVRASESIARSEYDYISLGEKHKGQYSCNPILDWNSAEVYAYIFAEDLPLNESYKRGNRRAGCLVCPRAAERNDYMACACYPNEFETLIGYIENQYSDSMPDKSRMNQFIENGGWKARKNGRDIIASSSVGYRTKVENGKEIIRVTNPRTDWKIWIKTIGILCNNESPYSISFRGKIFTFEVKELSDGYEVSFSDQLFRQETEFVKLLRNVFKKSASCVLCGVCEADCHNGSYTIIRKWIRCIIAFNHLCHDQSTFLIRLFILVSPAQGRVFIMQP